MHFDFAVERDNQSQASRPGTRGFRARWRARSSKAPSEPLPDEEQSENLSQCESQSLASWQEIEPEPKFKRSRLVDNSFLVDKSIKMDFVDTQHVSNISRLEAMNRFRSHDALGKGATCTNFWSTTDESIRQQHTGHAHSWTFEHVVSCHQEQAGHATSDWTHFQICCQTDCSVKMYNS